MLKFGVFLRNNIQNLLMIVLNRCLQEGFKYHHAEESYLMMTYWIPDEPNMLPANASHQVGVGGFVINDQMEVNHMCTVLLVRWGLISEKLCLSEF